MDRKFFLAALWCPLVVVIESLRCLFNNYTVSPAHMKKNTALMDLIQVSVTGLPIA